MEYTINHLSNKHDLVTYKTIFNTLSKKVDLFYETYAADLNKDDDVVLVNYLVNLNTRVNQWLKGITSEYMNNKESGNYFNSETENFESDEYNATTNTSEKIEMTTSKVINDFFTNNTNVRIIEMASKITDISYVSLLNTINEMKKNSVVTEVKMIVRNLLTLFITENKYEIADVKSENFTNYCLLVYNNSNTKNQLILDIKSTLESILTKYSDKYVATNRMATKINWKKAVFLVICLNVQYLS